MFTPVKDLFAKVKGVKKRSFRPNSVFVRVQSRIAYEPTVTSIHLALSCRD